MRRHQHLSKADRLLQELVLLLLLLLLRGSLSIGSVVCALSVVAKLRFRVRPRSFLQVPASTCMLDILAPMPVTSAGECDSGARGPAGEAGVEAT